MWRDSPWIHDSFEYFVFIGSFWIVFLEFISTSSLFKTVLAFSLFPTPPPNFSKKEFLQYIFVLVFLFLLFSKFGFLLLQKISPTKTGRFIGQSGYPRCSWLVGSSTSVPTDFFSLDGCLVELGGMFFCWERSVLYTRLWFRIFFYFHPYLGRWSKLTNVFRMGWNHQLDMF